MSKFVYISFKFVKYLGNQNKTTKQSLYFFANLWESTFGGAKSKSMMTQSTENSEHCTMWLISFYVTRTFLMNSATGEQYNNATIFHYSCWKPVKQNFLILLKFYGNKYIGLTVAYGMLPFAKLGKLTFN